MRNGCRACGYAWTPRGRALSDACPRCRGPHVYAMPHEVDSWLASHGIGLLIAAGGTLLVFGAIFAWCASL
jgi:hypothetical protein